MKLHLAILSLLVVCACGEGDGADCEKVEGRFTPTYTLDRTQATGHQGCGNQGSAVVSWGTPNLGKCTEVQSANDSCTHVKVIECHDAAGQQTRRGEWRVTVRDYDTLVGTYTIDAAASGSTPACVGDYTVVMRRVSP